MGAKSLKVKLTASLVFAGLSGACGVPHDDASDLSIVGGSEVTSSSASVARTGTVALTNADLFAEGKSFCTGTLVAPNLVITAAHCVTGPDGSISQEPMDIAFDTVMGRNASVTRKIRSIAVHSQWNPRIIGTVDPSAMPAHDIALVGFDGTAPAPWKPVPVVPSATTYGADHPVLLAGFGVTATRNVNTTGTLRAVRARIERSPTPGKILIIRGPELTVNAVSVNDFGQAVVVPANGGACAGDSGGPAYVSINGTPHVAGATSYGSELKLEGRSSGPRYCVGENGYVDLRAYAPGIAKAADALTAAMTQQSARTKHRFTNSGVTLVR
jgi:secreted trypsin-like serine protease